MLEHLENNNRICRKVPSSHQTLQRNNDLFDKEHTKSNRKEIIQPSLKFMREEQEQVKENTEKRIVNYICKKKKKDKNREATELKN